MANLDKAVIENVLNPPYLKITFDMLISIPPKYAVSQVVG